MPSVTDSSHIHNFLFHPLEIKDQDEKKWALITYVALSFLSLGVWLAIVLGVKRLDSNRVKKGPVETDPSRIPSPLQTNTPKPPESDSDEEDISIPDLTREKCLANGVAKGLKVPAKYRVDQNKFRERAATSTDIPTPNFGPNELRKLLNEVPEVKNWKGFKGNIVNNRYNLGMEQIFDSGLVTFGEGYSPLNKTFKHQYRVVLDKISKMPEKEKELKFKKLADAFKACQPEQARVVNGMYAQFMGLGGTFEAQMNAWIEEKKKEAFEQCIYELHPNCHESTNLPVDQLPHLTSGYLVLLGDELGMSDTKRARSDHNANIYLDYNRDQFLRLFWQKLQVEDLSRELVSQINQSLGDRFTNEQLVKWCNSNECFQLCYFDDCSKDMYYQQPSEDQFYMSAPFISEFGALQILQKIGYIQL